MSDTVTNEVEVDPNAPVVEINGVSKTLTKQTFGKLSKNKGQVFYAPEFSQSTFDTDVKWTGPMYVLGILNRNARKAFGEIYVDNINATTGKLDQEGWLHDAQDWTSGVTKLSDIEDEMLELQGQMSVLTEDEHFGETDESGNKTDACNELNSRIASLAAKLRPLRAEKLRISERYKDRVAKRDANTATTQAATT